MVSKKTKQKTRLYVIPGVGESTRAKNYSELIRHARKSGLIVMPVNIKWSSKMDITDFINQANKKIPDNSDSDYIIGFSLGAYIAAILSESKNAKGYIFCSISPYFKENLKLIPQESKKYWGVKIMKSFNKYNFPTKSKAQAWFFMGDKDWEIAQNAIKIFHKKWKGKKSLKYIKNVGHELSHPNYLKELKNLIKML